MNDKNKNVLLLFTDIVLAIQKCGNINRKKGVVDNTTGMEKVKGVVQIKFHDPRLVTRGRRHLNQTELGGGSRL